MIAKYNTNTHLGSVALEHPIMNAAGIRCRTIEEIKELLKCPISAIVIGSITLHQLSGNSGDVLYLDKEKGISINSLGIPNRGIDYYRENWPEIAQLAKENEKKIILSLYAQDVAYLWKLLNRAPKADITEINVGCSNILGSPLSASQHIQLTMESILENIKEDMLIGFKLPPITDWKHISQIAYTAFKYKKNVAYINCCNTYPYTYLPKAINASCQGRKTNLGGMGGSFLKPISLGQIQLFRQHLPSSVSLIGTGGIFTSEDVIDYINAGANAVQVGTAFAMYGHNVFGSILTQYIDSLERGEEKV